MVRHCCIVVALLGWATLARANPPAEKFFDELTYDFGSVPRGQTLTHPFRVVNKTDKTVQISNVRVSCGRCASARAIQTTLEPGQETVVLAQMFSSAFSGNKDISIYVAFAPKYEEVRLTVRANSREDLVYNPDSLNFGKVKRGAGAAQSMSISFYGGVPTRVMDAKSDSNYVQLSLAQTKGPGGEPVFQLEAKIRPDTPAGKWYTDIWVTTNNASMPKLRVPLTVEVEAALSVTPNFVSLGEIKAGGETDRKVIIRAAGPFLITNITGSDGELQVREAKSESKAVHVLTVTVRPSVVGELNRTIRVQTDIKNGGDIEFQAIANIIP